MDAQEKNTGTSTHTDETQKGGNGRQGGGTPHTHWTNPDADPGERGTRHWNSEEPRGSSRRDVDARREVLRVSGPADIVGIVPHLLGYRPEDRLVAVTLVEDDTGARTVGAILSWEPDPQWMPGVGADRPWTLAGTASRASAILVANGRMPDFVMLAAFGECFEAALDPVARTVDETVFGPAVEPLLDLADALVEAGVDLADPAWSSRDHLGSATEPGLVHPAAEADRSAAALALVLTGSAPESDFAAATRFDASGDARRARIAELREGSGEEDSGDGERSDEVAAWAAVQHDLCLLHVRIALDPQDGGEAAGPADDRQVALPSPEGVLGLDVVLSHLSGRDALQCVLGFDHPALGPVDLRALEPAEFRLRALALAADPNAVAEMPGLSARRPDFAALEASVGYLRQAAEFVLPEVRPAVLGMLAWLEFARGRNTFADEAAGRALELDPEHTMSRIVRAMVDAGRMPRWQYGPEGMWPGEDGRCAA
ncbi:DUF4192 family protein [Brevibacterium litoralis]|uniref:DUF4192 family protein n=1 Tax=Brevibacterium litoralis TaxID=3138935 RepID=UPI0032F06C54